MELGARRVIKLRGRHGPRGAGVSAVVLVVALVLAAAAPAAEDKMPPKTAITVPPPSRTVSTSTTIRFSANERRSRFECTLDGQPWRACDSPMRLAHLSAGQHTFAVRAIDEAGNADRTPATASWMVDLQAPETTITRAPPPHDRSAEATIKFRANEKASRFKCRIDKHAWEVCTSPTRLAQLAEGRHSIAVRATDQAGNADPSAATAAWSIDRTPPDTMITRAPTADSRSSSATLKFRASEKGVTYRCRLDKQPWQVCASPVKLTELAGGTHTFAVRATDEAGNVDGRAATATWTVTGAAPVKRICGTLRGDQTWTPSDASVYELTCDVFITGTLRLAAGTIVKAQSYGLYVDGTLTAEGTAADPVVLTSITDDSIGGDTNHDATDTRPGPGDWTGIVAGSGSRVALRNTNVRYAANGLRGNADAITITGGAWSRLSYAAIDVTTPDARIRNVAVSHAGDIPFYVQSDQLDLSRLTGNTATDGARGFALNGTITASTPWPAQPMPWVLHCGVIIDQAATVTIEPATIIKTDGCGLGGLYVDGTLTAEGTAADPVVLTSITDDSIGGDTNHDATDTRPGPGDWTGIVYRSPSRSVTSNLGFIDIRYAGTGMDVGENVTLAVRGRFTHNVTAISACDWSTTCAVDAAYTYWGSGDGPVDGHGDPLVCGAVTVSPWLTTGDPDGPTRSGGLFAASNCSGASTPQSHLEKSKNRYSLAMAAAQIDCSNGFEDACATITTARQCLSAAFELARSQAGFPMSQPEDVVDAAAESVEGSELRTVSNIAFVTRWAVGLYTAVTAILDIADAYATCAPGSR